MDEIFRKIREKRAEDPEAWDRSVEENAAIMAAPVSCLETADGWIARKAGMAGVGPTKKDAIEDVWKKLRLQLGRKPKA